MKKLLINVDGKQYEVEVEVISDDEDAILPPYYRQNVPRVEMAHPVAPGDAPAAAHSAPAPKNKVKQPVDGKSVTSQMNGIVLEIPVSVGQSVKENDVVIVLEAMKMKTNISAPFTGTIKSIDVKVNDNIEAGQVLLTCK
jgi:glutaconyl-CoA/methylmalonyl-CoA decarboxylase subunit gamma